VNNKSLSLGEAASKFLGGLPAEKRTAGQQDIYQFVRWFGRERMVSGLRAPEIAKYAEQLSQSDRDCFARLELVRAFLINARKEGWTQTGLATHLKVRKGKRPASSRQDMVQSVPLTQEGYAKLEAELAALKNKRPEIIKEIHRAAADKDFRENAPLEAARQQHGQLEGRIRELENTLKSAVIIESLKEKANKACVGDTVVMRDLSSGENLQYMLVGTKEVDPARGKISSASPIGKVIIGKGEGETVQVKVPAGMLRYKIVRIER
jgi:transcription elongation factor GreA